MAPHATAWASYIPVPGVSLLVAMSAPKDRLVRFHARQATAVTMFAFIMLILLGLLAKVMPGAQPVIVTAAGVVMVVTILSVLVGAVGASRGRFTRVRPFWDLLARPT